MFRITCYHVFFSFLNYLQFSLLFHSLTEIFKKYIRNYWFSIKRTSRHLLSCTCFQSSAVSHILLGEIKFRGERATHQKITQEQTRRGFERQRTAYSACSLLKIKTMRCYLRKSPFISKTGSIKSTNPSTGW